MLHWKSHIVYFKENEISDSTMADQDVHVNHLVKCLLRSS